VPVTKVYPPRSLGQTKMRPLVDWWSILRPLVYGGLGIEPRAGVTGRNRR